MENVILREYFDASQIDDRLSWFKLTAQSFCIPSILERNTSLGMSVLIGFYN